MKNTGYKAMLRDKVPYIANLALKWCNSKERWVNHVYGSQIAIYCANSAKNDITRHILGLSKGSTFDFHKTIDWENLDKSNTTHWNFVENWVNWFSSNYMYIQNTYEISKENGKDISSIKTELKSSYLSSLEPAWQDKLVTFLIESFKDYELFPKYFNQSCTFL